jgi:hypothetical protein
MVAPVDFLPRHPVTLKQQRRVVGPIAFRLLEHRGEARGDGHRNALDLLLATPFVARRHHQSRIGTVGLQIDTSQPGHLRNARTCLRQDLDQEAEGVVLLISRLDDAQHVGIGQHDTAGRKIKANSFMQKLMTIA